MRIIYIEDNIINIALVERICKMNRDDLVTFRDVDAALLQIEKGSADLILVDVNLGNGKIDGLELTNQLRQRGVKIPVVAITAYDNRGYADQYVAAGCDEYMSKPIEVRKLLNVMSKYRPSTYDSASV
jgi:CheY-like chemotaxis protein